MTNVLSGVRCKQLLQANVHGVDGDLGKSKDLYFDDSTWAIRYLVVDTGKWLPGRKVLVSPHALAPTPFSGGSLVVNLSQDQIRNSPDVSTDKPVSRQEEEKLGIYYGWPPVVPAPIVGGGMMAAGYTYSGAHYAHSGPPPEASKEDAPDYDSHLRSLREVLTYSVVAKDGDLGTPEDFLADLSTSRFASLVVAPDRKHEIILPVDTIGGIDWQNRLIHIRRTRHEVAGGLFDR